MQDREDLRGGTQIKEMWKKGTLIAELKLARCGIGMGLRCGSGDRECESRMGMFYSQLNSRGVESMKILGVRQYDKMSNDPRNRNACLDILFSDVGGSNMIHGIGLNCLARFGSSTSNSVGQGMLPRRGVSVHAETPKPKGP